MAIIPTLGSTNRRLSVLPDVRRGNVSVADDVVRSVGTIAKSIGDVVDARDRLRSAELVAQQKRNQLEEQRLAAEARETDRSAQVLANQVDMAVRQRWNGTVVLNEDGTTTEVPGVIAKSWREMDADKKTAPQYLAEIFEDVKKQEFYTNASPEVVEAAQKYLRTKATAWGDAAFKFQSASSMQKKKDQTEELFAYQSGLVQEVEAADNATFALTSNSAALHKVALLYGSAIANPEVIEEGVPTKEGNVRPASIDDLVLVGDDGSNPAARAALVNSYKAITVEHLKNRITNLSRFVAANKPCGAVDTDTLVKRCNDSIAFLKEAGVTDANQDEALRGMMDKAVASRDKVRNSVLLDNAAKLNTDLDMLQIKLETETFDPQGYADKIGKAVAQGLITPESGADLTVRYRSLARMHDTIVNLKNVEALGDPEGAFPKESNGYVVYKIEEDIAKWRNGKGDILEIEKDFEDAKKERQLSLGHAISLMRQINSAKREQAGNVFLEVTSEVLEAEQGDIKGAYYKGDKKAQKSILRKAEYDLSRPWYQLGDGDTAFTADELIEFMDAISEFSKEHNEQETREFARGLVSPKVDAILKKRMSQRIIDAHTQGVIGK